MAHKVSCRGDEGEGFAELVEGGEEFPEEKGEEEDEGGQAEGPGGDAGGPVGGEPAIGVLGVAQGEEDGDRG